MDCQYLYVAGLDYFVSFAVMLALGLFIAQLSEKNKTEIQRTKDLLQQNRQAERSIDRETIRSALLRSIGHDLRTPLATIMGSSSLMADKSFILSTQQYLEQADNIYQQSLILKNQIDKMLELSRIQNLATLRIQRNIPVAEMVSSAFARRPTLNTADVSLKFELSRFNCDPDLMEVALANMIENAITHGDHPIILRVLMIDNRYAIELTNNIKPNPVHRADSSGGIGVSICQAIAKLHNGHFSLATSLNTATAMIQWEKTC